MHPAVYVFIAGLILAAVGPFIPSAAVFLAGLVLAVGILTIAALAWLERHLP